MLAACALWVHGEAPLLLDMRAVHDFDHVVALYRRNGFWGAISKTNGIFLRSRDPVYRDLRELAMSYFHEYTNRRHQKTLRSYSAAFDLRRMDPAMWVTNPKQCWDVGWAMEAVRHYPVVSKRQHKFLRLKDGIEREAQKIKMYKPPPAKSRR